MSHEQSQQSKNSPKLQQHNINTVLRTANVSFNLRGLTYYCMCLIIQDVDTEGRQPDGT